MTDEKELRRIALEASLNAQKVTGYAVPIGGLVDGAERIHEYLLATGSTDEK